MQKQQSAVKHGDMGGQEHQIYSSTPQPTHRSGSAIQMRNSASRSKADGEP